MKAISKVASKVDDAVDVGKVVVKKVAKGIAKGLSKADDVGGLVKGTIELESKTGLLGKAAETINTVMKINDVREDALTLYEGAGDLKSTLTDIIDKIPNDVKEHGKCDKFADALEDALNNAGVVNERLKVESDFGIYSDKAVDMSGTNGYHDAVKVGDTVYDNMNLDGMPYDEWLKDLGIGLDPNIRLK